MTKVLVSDPIDQLGIDILSQVATVDVRTGLSPEELVASIGDYDGLMIRSGTQVTAEVIEAATRLKIIGRAGVGVDNVDVPAATKQGVIVVNSPEGNTIAAAEHALAMMLSLSRHIPAAHPSTTGGGWDRRGSCRRRRRPRRRRRLRPAPGSGSVEGELPQDRSA